MARRSPRGAGGVAEDVQGVHARTGTPPGLATVLIGDDAASAVYVAGKQKACAEVGIKRLRPPAARRRAARRGDRAARRAERRPGGQRDPLPASGPRAAGRRGADEPHRRRQGRRRPDDRQRRRLALGMDGLRSCTPTGVMILLEEAGAELEGAECVVVGRSNLFGKPMAQLLLGANATVTTCHSRTRDLPGVCRRADVLIAAVGRPEMVKGDWVKPGAIVIDVGMNRLRVRARRETSTSPRQPRSRARSRRARRRRADDDRVPAAQHAAGRRSRGRRALGCAPMRLNRLRVGECVALAGAVGLLVVMSLRWYEPGGSAAVFGDSCPSCTPPAGPPSAGSRWPPRSSRSSSACSGCWRRSRTTRPPCPSPARSSRSASG